MQLITTPLTLALAGFLSLYALWVFYLAVMALKRARDAGTLTKTARVMGTPVLFIGLLLDFLVNVTVMTVLFAELPKEWLVTSRLQRHAKHDDKPGCMRVVAWLRQFLDPFDPSGKHI